LFSCENDELSCYYTDAKRDNEEILKEFTTVSMHRFKAGDGQTLTEPHLLRKVRQSALPQARQPPYVARISHEQNRLWY